MRLRSAKPFAALAAICIFAGALGCYESIYRLSPVADAKVERELCGDWKLAGSKGGEILMGVRNIDDRFYAVSWRSSDSQEALHLVADSTRVQEVRFVHARSLPDDGTLSDSHLILRVDVEGDRITVRPVSDDFMNDKTVESDEGLRSIIEANLENNDLYDDVNFVGERVRQEN